MDRVKLLLLPTGLVVLFVLLTHIDGIYAAGVKAASDTTYLSNFLGGFFGFVVIALLILAIIGFVRNAAP